MAKRLAIGLSEGFADWECALLMATARDDLGIAVATLTPGGRDVSSVGGLSVVSGGLLEEASPADYEAFVLCGGKIYYDGDKGRVTNMVKMGNRTIDPNEFLTRNYREGFKLT